MSLTREQLYSLHEQMTTKARETMQAKNQDYATDGDVFRNFRLFGGLGILVRLSDKLARLRTFEERGTFSVEDEKLSDTIQDAINYAVLYYAWTQDNKPVEIKAGPRCDFCKQPADFAVDSDREQFTCSNCACERNLFLKEL